MIGNPSHPRSLVGYGERENFGSVDFPSPSYCDRLIHIQLLCGPTDSIDDCHINTLTAISRYIWSRLHVILLAYLVFMYNYEYRRKKKFFFLFIVVNVIFPKKNRGKHTWYHHYHCITEQLDRIEVRCNHGIQIKSVDKII